MNRTVNDVAKWWDERPCNVRHSDAPIGSAEYSQQVTWTKYFREPHIIDFLRPWKWSGKNVLEVGCGIGTDTLTLVQAGANVHAVDVSMASLRIADQRANATLTDEQCTRVSFAKHDVEKPLRLATAPDLIYSFGVLHHTPNPDVALRNLRAVADPHTELRIMLYHRWSTKGIRLGLTDERIALGSEAREACPVTYAYSRRQARELLLRTGWDVTRMRVDHIFKYDVAALQEGRYEIAAPWRFLPPVVFRELERVLGWHLLIVARPIPGSGRND